MDPRSLPSSMENCNSHSNPQTRWKGTQTYFTPLSKIMECLILSRLLWNLSKPDNLFGFTKGRSTVDAILHLVNLITSRGKYNKDKNFFSIHIPLTCVPPRICPLPYIIQCISYSPYLHLPTTMRQSSHIPATLPKNLK